MTNRQYTNTNLRTTVRASTQTIIVYLIDLIDHKMTNCKLQHIHIHNFKYAMKL